MKPEEQSPSSVPPSVPVAPQGPPKMKFGEALWKLTVLLLFFGFIYGGVAAWWAHKFAGREDVERLPYAVGGGLGFVLFPILGAWIAYLINRRARIPANVVALTLLALFSASSALNLFKGMVQAKKDVLPVLMEMTTELSSTKEAIAEASMSGDNGTANQLEMENIAVLRKYQKQIGGPMGEFLGVAADYRGSLQSASVAYDEVVLEIEANQIWDFSGDFTLEDLDERTKLIEKWIAVNKDVLDSYENRGVLEAAMKKLPKGDQQDFGRGMIRALEKNAPVVIAIRNEDRAMGVLVLEALDLLRKNWGKVELAENLVDCVFEDSGAEVRKMEIVEAIDEAAERQLKVQEEYFK